MYWTGNLAGTVHRAGMDGSSPVTLVTGLGLPRGLTIDFASQRLYWTEFSGHKIKSSNLNGKDIQLFAQLPSGSQPWGIAVLNDRIYWGNQGNYKLQSGATDEAEYKTLYTETNSIRHLTVVSGVDQPTKRRNDCAGQKCSTLCVLTPTLYRCLQ